MKKFTSLVGSTLLILLALFPRAVNVDSDAKVESYLTAYNTAYTDSGKSSDTPVVLTDNGEIASGNDYTTSNSNK